MFNRVLWTLDTQTDGTTFERLCVDLLSREGYPHIVPIGGVHDRGRDAEIRELSGTITFFQFSLEESWLGKLRRELRKVQGYGHTVDIYIFVTNRKVTGRKRDNLTKEVEHKYGWRLVLFDREWLRNRLEEQHPDLAAKYLGIPNTTYTLNKLSIQVEHPAITYAEQGNAYLNQGDFEAAIVAYKRQLAAEPDDTLWNALAFCQYHLERYDDALHSIQQALHQNPGDIVYRTAYAAILIEHGIERNERAQLVQAKRIFQELVQESKSWQSHYNFGNVLVALGEHEKARSEYLAALALDESAAPIWTNLGNTHFSLQNFDEAMRCYDKALTLAPDSREALASKGIALLQLENRQDEAIPLIERAIGESTLPIQWRHGWYWLGLAHLEVGRLESALESTNHGLDLLPGQLGLLNLKASILSKLWRQDAQYIAPSIEFFAFLHELGTATYPATTELAQLYFTQGNADKAVGLLQANYEIPLENLDAAIQAIGRFDLNSVLLSFKHLALYTRYRQGSSIEAYFEPITKQGIHVSDEILGRASIGASVLFALFYEKLLRTEAHDRRSALESLQSAGLEHFMQIILDIYKELRGQVESPDSQQAFALKSVVVKYAMMEWTFQLGWIAGKLQMAEEDVKAALDRQLDDDNSAISRWLNELFDFITDDKDLGLSGMSIP